MTHIPPMERKLRQQVENLQEDMTEVKHEGRFWRRRYFDLLTILAHRILNGMATEEHVRCILRNEKAFEAEKVGKHVIFDISVHKAVEGSPLPGDTVEVVKPGFAYDNGTDGEHLVALIEAEVKEVK